MKSLVISAQRGNKEAFATLIREYKKTLYRTGRCYLKDDEDIADAIQDTILTCYEKLDTLRHPEFFKTWMVRIMINQCKQILKQKKYHEDINEVEAGFLHKPMESNICFQDMMNSLDPAYRSVMSLYYGDNFSVKEIAEILELTESNVKKRLSRGREALKNGYFKHVDL